MLNTLPSTHPARGARPGQVQYPDAPHDRGTALAAAYLGYKAQGVEFVGVAIWDIEDEAKRFAVASGATYPMGVDTKGNIAIDYGLTGIPEKYFIDADGKIVRKFVGPVSEEILESVFSELLPQS